MFSYPVSSSAARPSADTRPQLCHNEIYSSSGTHLRTQIRSSRNLSRTTKMLIYLHTNLVTFVLLSSAYCHCVSTNRYTFCLVTITEPSEDCREPAEIEVKVQIAQQYTPPSERWTSDSNERRKHTTDFNTRRMQSTSASVCVRSCVCSRVRALLCVWKRKSVFKSEGWWRWGWGVAGHWYLRRAQMRR